MPKVWEFGRRAGSFQFPPFNFELYRAADDDRQKESESAARIIDLFERVRRKRSETIGALRLTEVRPPVPQNLIRPESRHV